MCCFTHNILDNIVCAADHSLFRTIQGHLGLDIYFLIEQRFSGFTMRPLIDSSPGSRQ